MNMIDQRTLLRLGEHRDVVVVKTDTPMDGEARLYVASSMADQIGASLNVAQVKMLAKVLTEWLDEQIGFVGTTPAARYQRVVGMTNDPARPLAIEPRSVIDKTIEPIEVEVWSLLVQSPDRKHPVVTVHATEDECEARFREEYDPDDEGANMTFNDLAEHLNITFDLDIHTVEAYPKKEKS